MRTMLRSLVAIFTGIGFCFFVTSLRADSLEKKWAYRVIEGQLLDVDGKPVRDATVLLLGVDRFSMCNAEEAVKDVNHHFRTDREGRFAVKLGKFASYEYLEKEKKSFPGWGVYFFVVLPFGESPGAVGPRMVNLEAMGSRQYSKDEWGEPFLIQEGVNKVIFNLKKGISIKGRVVNMRDKPISGLDIRLWHDLHAGTHTGYGGEILDRSETTDKNGEFAFKNVYPANVHFGKDDPYNRFQEGEIYWVRTKLNDRWYEEIVDILPVTPKTQSISIEMVMSEKKLYRYFGLILDQEGKPVLDSKVVVGISMHRQTQTFEDGHHYEEYHGDSGGKFDILTATPWVRGFSVRKSGFADEDLWSNDEKMFQPGEYNFQMKRKLK